jgi:hypothetical protein
MTNEKEYLSDILFHFWCHQPEDRAFEVFVSIIEKGFLLTRGTGELLDRFYYLRKDGNSILLNVFKMDEYVSRIFLKIRYSAIVRDMANVGLDLQDKPSLTGAGAQFGIYPIILLKKPYKITRAAWYMALLMR